MMRLLSLDLSTHTGWACGSLLPQPVTHGVLHLPKTGEDIGRFLCCFREWLGHAIEELAPTDIIFESPVLPDTTSLATCRKLYGLSGVTEMIAGDYKIPTEEANLNDIRRHFIGTARAPKDIVGSDKRRAWLKGRTIDECRRRGFRVADDNDGDALALLSYALQLKKPDFYLRAVEPERSAA